MKKQILNLYYVLPNLENTLFVSKLVNKLFEKLLIRWFSYSLPAYFKKTKSRKEYSLIQGAGKEMGVIASLTSFPGRIQTTWLSVEGIFRQSVRPERIILWLASEQFPNGENDLPKELKAQTTRGLEIRFCEDLRSHKKYYYTLKEFPTAKVILFDDDLFYHEDVIKNLLDLNKKWPEHVCATRVHRMKFDESGELLPYRHWHINYNGKDPSLYNHHNSGHGTLIPGMKLLDETFFNRELFLDLCPKSDDVWFKVNLIRLRIPVVSNGRFNKDTISIKSTYKTSLVADNSHKGLKDDQLKRTLEYFDLKLDPNLNTFAIRA